MTGKEKRAGYPALLTLRLLSVVAAAAEYDDNSEDDNPGAVVVKDVA